MEHALRSFLTRHNLGAIGCMAAAATLLAAPAGGDLTAQGNELWHRGNPEADSEFGRAVASGDFNGDGYGDMAVGAPWEQVGSAAQSGRVRVFYGSDLGLSSSGQLVLSGNRPGCGVADPGDGFGMALAAGDFDGDGYDDLAIGVPFVDIGSILEDVGSIKVVDGGSGGLSGTCTGFLQGINTAGYEDFDYFGWALAVADFDDDGYDDLAVGVPGEDVGNIIDAGAVSAFYGSATGLSVDREQVWSQNSPGTQGGSEPGDEFGAALAAGDFDGDGDGDLAVGIHFEDLGALLDAGAVHLFRGSSPGGLMAAGDQIWHQNTSGVQDTAEEGDEFGFSLTAADFDGDGHDDLAIGVPREAVSVWTWAGAVHTLFGSATGLTATDDQFWHQDVPGTAGAAEPGDLFGWALAAGDFDANGTADLAVGVVAEDVGAVVDGAGAVHILHGADPGLSVAGNRIWHQNQPGVVDQAENWDQFGTSLAVGDFDGNGAGDLAIGVPAEDIGAVQDAGAVHLFYAQPGIFTDDFESGDTTAWSQTVP